MTQRDEPRIGDTVYETDGVRIYKSKVLEINEEPIGGKIEKIYTTNTSCFDARAIGLSIFLSAKEAARKMKSYD